MTLDGIKKYVPTKELLISLGDQIRFSGSIRDQTLSKIVEILTGQVFNYHGHIVRSDLVPDLRRKRTMLPNSERCRINKIKG